MFIFTLSFDQVSGLRNGIFLSLEVSGNCGCGLTEVQILRGFDGNGRLFGKTRLTNDDAVFARARSAIERVLQGAMGPALRLGHAGSRHEHRHLRLDAPDARQASAVCWFPGRKTSVTGES